MKHTQNSDESFFREDFEHFFEQSLAGFLIADSQNIIVQSNSRLANWLGTNTQELKGKRFADLLSIGSKIYYETHLWPLMQMQGFFDEVLIELYNSSGQRLKVLVNAVEFGKKSDSLHRIYYTITKATDRIQYEQNLQFAKNVAEKGLEAEKENVLLREQLIAVLGHDLRNPLGAISMAVELLRDSSNNSKSAEILATLKRSTYRMTELITNIMDFARTRLGEGIIIIPQDVIIEPLLQQVIEELKLVFPKREIDTVFTINGSVRCDPDRIAQLLSNLLANALTHGSTDAPVQVFATYIDKILEISMVNKGEPIPEDLHNLLFSPFSKEGNRPSKNGLGLGLYISAEIARAHNGRLSFTSNADETRFTFYMPS